MVNNEILSRPSLGERGWLLSQLRNETVGGGILLFRGCFGSRVGKLPVG